MKKLISYGLIVLMGLVQPGCAVVLVGAGAAGGTYWYMTKHRKCPNCMKQISARATVCPHCQRDVVPEEPKGHKYRKTAFGKVACIYCDELIVKEATVCPKCKKDVPPLTGQEPTVDAVTKKMKCPECKKSISPEALVCPTCKHSFE